MKTKGMIIGAILLSLVLGTNVFASETSAQNKAERELKVQLQKEFKKLPFADISGLENNNEVFVSFTVTENNEVEILKIQSENEELKRHAEITLKDNQVEAADLLKGESYKVKMRFEVKI